MKEKDAIDPVDKLVESGISAMAEGESEAAAMRFRKALRLAPFRQDIKQLLAEALDKRPLEGKPQPPKTRKKKKSTPAPPRKKGGIKIGLWLLIFSALCLSSLAFFFFFSSTIQQFIGNLATARNEAKISPSDREAATLYKTAELLQDQRRYAEAIQALQKALENNPTDEKQFEIKLAELFFEQGEDFYKKDEYLKAIESYKKAVEYNPDSEEYYYGLGWAYYIQGRKNQNRRKPYHTYFDNALDAFLKVLERETDNLRAKNAMARVYIARNETPRAAEMYRQIIRDSPDSREAEKAKRALKSMGFRL